MNNLYEKTIQDSDIGYAFHKIICDSRGIPCDYKCIEVNKAFEEYTGLVAEDLFGEKINNLLPCKLREDINLIDYYEKIARQATIEKYEKYFKSTNRWCMIKIFSPEKHILVINCIDITETKKQLLNKIEESRIILWQVVNTIPSEMFWKDMEFKYLGCNREFAENLGCSISEIIGKDDYEIGRKEISDTYRKDDEDVIRTGIPKINFEKQVTMPNGEKRWIRSNKIPLYDDNNKIYGIFGSLDDITREKELEKELMISRIRHEQVARKSRSVVWEVDRNGLYKYISSVSRELYGYSPDEMIGKKHVYEAVEKDLEDKYKEFFYRL